MADMAPAAAAKLITILADSHARAKIAAYVAE
jgi:hypothetical protein